MMQWFVFIIFGIFVLSGSVNDSRESQKSIWIHLWVLSDATEALGQQQTDRQFPGYVCGALALSATAFEQNCSLALDIVSRYRRAVCLFVFRTMSKNDAARMTKLDV